MHETLIFTPKKKKIIKKITPELHLRAQFLSQAFKLSQLDMNCQLDNMRGVLKVINI